jgi:hypothetical protein
MTMRCSVTLKAPSGSAWRHAHKRRIEMHVTDKIVDKDGVHILSSTLEADGPFQLASDKAALDAQVIALRRTESGGVFLQTAVKITEPKTEAPKAEEPPVPEPTPEEQAAEYLVSTGLSQKEADAAVERFGARKILAKKQTALDAELDALLGKKGEPEAPKA